MTKTTMVFAVLMIALGIAAFVGAGRSNSMVLVPMWWGLAMGVLAFIGIKRSEKKRNLFIQFNAVIAVIGIIWAAAEAIRGYGAARMAGVAPDRLALYSEIAMAILLFIYAAICMRWLLELRQVPAK